MISLLIPLAALGISGEPEPDHLQTATNYAQRLPGQETTFLSSAIAYFVEHELRILFRGTDPYDAEDWAAFLEHYQVCGQTFA